MSQAEISWNEVIKVMRYSGMIFWKVVSLQNVVESPKYIDVPGLIIFMFWDMLSSMNKCVKKLKEFITQAIIIMLRDLLSSMNKCVKKLK